MKKSTKLKRQIVFMKDELIDFKKCCNKQFKLNKTDFVPKAFYLGESFTISQFNNRCKTLEFEIGETNNELCNAEVNESIRWKSKISGRWVSTKQYSKENNNIKVIINDIKTI